MSQGNIAAVASSFAARVIYSREWQSGGQRSWRNGCAGGAVVRWGDGGRGLRLEVWVVNTRPQEE